MTRRWFWPGLGAVLLVALVLRLVGLDWDKGLYLHPDERFVVWVTTDLRWPASFGQFFDSSTSPLNPYNTQHGSFVYGTMPSFVVKAFGGLLNMDRYGELHLVGRGVNAVADTITVFLTALLARRFFSPAAGLLAGLLLAFTPLFLQSAHYFTVDTMSVTFAVAVVVCVMQSWDRRSLTWIALAGMMVGLAGASKLNFLASIAFLALPAAELVRQHGWASLIPEPRNNRYPAVVALFIGAAAAALTFRIAQPYAFVGPNIWDVQLNPQWTADLAFWRSAQTGLVDIKPSIQWVDRTPVVYLLENMVLWGMGPFLGLASLVAAAVATWRVFRYRSWPNWWMIGILGWCVGNVLLFGTGIAQNQRYLMPIYPFLIVLAAGMLTELVSRMPRQWWPKALTVAVAGYTMFYGIALDSVFVRPITRIEASEWIYENVPAGAVLTHEYWDDALPMALPGMDRSQYTSMTVDLYAQEFEDNSKVSTLVGQLSQVDYIVLSSNRVIDSVVRQPERYPVAVRYYEMLLSGELGFEPVAEFTQGPELFGIEWDDTGAEESLIVYEHPQVRIFRKTDAFNPQYISDELYAAWGTGAYHSIPGDPSPRQMLLSADALRLNNQHGSWSEQFGRGWLREHPVLAWYVAIQTIGVAAWPLTWRAFRNLPDAGFMLAKGVGILAMGALVLALVTWTNRVFAPGTVVLALMLITAMGFACKRCVWEGFLPAIRGKVPAILLGEGVFLLAWLWAAFVRAHQPVQADHHAMQLTGVIRSSTLPPLDPWMSGGALHTAWSPLLPWAAIAKTVGTEPTVAFNLLVIGCMALLAGVSWSIVHGLTRSWIAIAAPIVVIAGGTANGEGALTSLVFGSSVDVRLAASLVVVAVMLHMVMFAERVNAVQVCLIALGFGAVLTSGAWGAMVGVVLVVAGQVINTWLVHRGQSPWWPAVRNMVLIAVAIIFGGALMWYPAIAAYTPTVRGLVVPEATTIGQLWGAFGVLLALVIGIMLTGFLRVLNETVKEGPIGIVATGIALAVAVLFVALAVAQDSAVILMLATGMAAVVAAWVWLRQRSLLWCAALVLIGSGLLTLAMARPSRPDIVGIAQFQQLYPLAWIVFGIAISLVISRLIEAYDDRSGRIAMGLGIALIVISIAYPSLDRSIRIASENSPVSLSRPVVEGVSGYDSAIEWLATNTNGVPVVLTAVALDQPSTGSLNAATGYPTLIGWPDAERRLRPGWESLVDRRINDQATIYNPGTSIEETLSLLRQYHVEYIVVGGNERLLYGEGTSTKFDDAVANGEMERVFEGDGIRIYRVVNNLP